MLRFLRLISILLVSFIACIGLTKDYIATGHLNKVDFYTLIATGVLTLLGILAEYFQYREDNKKDKETEEQFLRLGQSMNKPIFPIQLVYVLRHSVKEDTVQEYFGKYILAYRKLQATNPPNSVFLNDAISEFDYVEKLGDENFIAVQLNEEDLYNAEKLYKTHLDRDGIVKPLTNAKIEFYKPKKGKFIDKPDIVITATIDFVNHKPIETIKKVRLICENIYQSCTVSNFRITKSTENILTVMDLKGSKIKATFTYSVHGNYTIDRNPKFTTLSLVFGTSPMTFVSFNVKQLPDPKVKRENLIFSVIDEKLGDPNDLIIEYEIMLPTDEKEFELLLHQKT